ncbi:MAG TPA: hypothetical protein VI583_00855 [Cyclobacteriaceae bacterium]|nr:hypothetical protein [Cyclobacteriaceae bacterium]
MPSCTEDFLTREPLGVISEKMLEDKEGLDGLLIGAYAQIDGQGSSNNGIWASAPSNWIYGSLTSDDANHGSDNLDSGPWGLFEG